MPRPVPTAYSFPPLPRLDEIDLTQVSPWAQLEVLRIELLLRSPTVQTICLREREAEQLILDSYDVPLLPALQGWHHQLLLPTGALERAGITHLRLRATDPSDQSVHDGQVPNAAPDSRYLYLRIDAAHTPTTILTALRPLLRERHAQLPSQIRHAMVDEIRIGRGLFRRFHRASQTKRKPPVTLSTWFTYLRCYDVHQAKPTLSYGQIALKIFPEEPTPISTDRVKKTLTRVRRLMDLVEREDWRAHWPPPAGFLRTS